MGILARACRSKQALPGVKKGLFYRLHKVAHFIALGLTDGYFVNFGQIGLLASLLGKA